MSSGSEHSVTDVRVTLGKMTSWRLSFLNCKPMSLKLEISKMHFLNAKIIYY